MASSRNSGTQPMTPKNTGPWLQPPLLISYSNRPKYTCNSTAIDTTASFSTNQPAGAMNSISAMPSRIANTAAGVET